MDPLTKGDYPLIMKQILNERFPRFTVKEASLVKGSYDFIGINYYITQFARSVPPANPDRLSVMTDSQTELSCKSSLARNVRFRNCNFISINYVFPVWLSKSLVYYIFTC